MLEMLDVVEGMARYAKMLRTNLHMIVFDEADSVLQPLSRYATNREMERRAVHPKAGERLLQRLVQYVDGEQIRSPPSAHAAAIDDGGAGASATTPTAPNDDSGSRVRVYQRTSRSAQFVFASATANMPLRSMLHHMLLRPLPKTVRPAVPAPDPASDAADTRFVAPPRDPTPLPIEHVYALCESLEVKLAVLRRLFDDGRIADRALLFIPDDAQIDNTVRHLNEQIGLPAVALYRYVATHDVAEHRRFRERFAAGEIRIVVANESAARGLHFDGLRHVVMSQPAASPGSYLHMSGRVGRLGQGGGRGLALTLVTAAELLRLRRIGHLLGIAYGSA